MKRRLHIQGCLFGTAIGDAIGLPRERLSRHRASRLFGHRPLKHAFIASRGMCSDDTEHAVMVAQALVISGGDLNRFIHDLASRLRWWLVRIPAGIGFATLRACIKLWLGFGPDRSGVISAGNGPAMRSALLGIVAHSAPHLLELVRGCTRITHRDPRAEQGALIVATTARLIVSSPSNTIDPSLLEVEILPLATDDELRSNMRSAFVAKREGLTPQQFADSLGQHEGISGYINLSVPIAFYCWLANRGSFRDAVESAVCLGGDSDTIGAITGALAGTELGPDSIPREWLDGLIEWPCSVEWMRKLAGQLADSITNDRSIAATRRSAVLILLRNLLFTLIVLTHGFRRVFPPY